MEGFKTLAIKDCKVDIYAFGATIFQIIEGTTRKFLNQNIINKAKSNLGMRFKDLLLNMTNEDAPQNRKNIDQVIMSIL